MSVEWSDQSGTITEKKGSLFAATVEFMIEFFYSLGQSLKETKLNPRFFSFFVHASIFRAHFWTSGIKDIQKILVRVKEHLCSVKMLN